MPTVIAIYLTSLGYRARSGKPWHHATIRGILCNLTYTGVLRCGESRSELLRHLQIIEPSVFEEAQKIRTQRADKASKEPRVPLSVKGQSLLAGNVYCGHCGARLALTTSGRRYPCKDNPNRVVKRVRYICYGKTRKQTECNGPTGYTAHILDDIVSKVVLRIFELTRSTPKEEIVGASYRKKLEERKAILNSVRREYTKATEDLSSLKNEVIKAIRGESSFSTNILNSLITEAEEKCLTLQQQFEAAKALYEDTQLDLESLNSQYDNINTWADIYETANMETKRMITACLINRVDVFRDYKLHIDFNIDFEQFQFGLDISQYSA